MHERLVAYDAEWRVVNDYHALAQIAGRDAHTLTLCDVTHLARCGYKGRGTSAWLSAQGLTLPSAPNRWLRDATGCLIARLGHEDYLISDDVGYASGVPARLEQSRSHDPPAAAHLVPRQYGLACLAVCGANAAALFARLCAVDVHPAHFGDDAIAQTLLANTIATILRRDRGAETGYMIFVDTTVALYLWDLLLEVATSLGGGAIGFTQLTPD